MKLKFSIENRYRRCIIFVALKVIFDSIYLKFHKQNTPIVQKICASKIYTIDADSYLYE